MLLQSTSTYLAKYNASHPRRPNGNIHHCYNIISQKKSNPAPGKKENV